MLARFLIVAVLLLSQVVAQKVIRVPRDYTTLNLAAKAASEGDTILFAQGYRPSGFATITKSLTILAELGTFDAIFRNVRGPITICNLAATRSSNGSLTFESCTGPILIQDSVFNRISAKSCSSITVTRCVVNNYAVNRIANTKLAMWDSSVMSDNRLNVSGYPGLELTGGTLFLSGCTIRGSAGRDAYQVGTPPFCFPGTPGGDGLKLVGGGKATIVGGTIAPGPGGLANCTSTNRLSSGRRIANAGWTVREVSGPIRSLISRSVVRPGETWKLQVLTQKGDILAVGLGTSYHSAEVPNVLGFMNLLPIGVLVWEAGTRPGKTVVELKVPGLPSGVDSLDVALQGAVATSRGLVFTNPAGLTLLDSRF